MPRPAFSAVLRDRARELKKGRTRGAVQKLLAAEGHTVSLAWLTNVLREPAPAPSETTPPAPRTPAKTLRPPAPAAAPAPAELPEPVDPGEPVALLRRSVAVLEELGRVARANGSIEDFSKCQRGINAALALAAKLAPVEPVDANALPDMVSAAKRARLKLFDLLSKCATPPTEAP